MIDYRIKPIAGFEPRVGEVVSMLQHTRETTLEEIKELDLHGLDFLPDRTANSIGSLLAHIAAIEYVHQVISFERRDLTPAEMMNWEPALFLGEAGRKEIKGNPLSFYVDQLQGIRENTISLMKSAADEWLYEEKKWPNGIPHNNYYLWFHVAEDEISHRGQIRSIKRLLQSSK